MNTYRVTVHLDITKTVEVEAENEDRAKEMAYDECRRDGDIYDVISNEAELIESEES